MRPASPIPPVKTETPATCTLCHAPSPDRIGDRDFGDNGNDFFSGRRTFEPYGVRIAYFRCGGCGFTFTNAFDDWSAEDFALHVYNEDYTLTDPPFLHERPTRNAKVVSGLWHRDKGRSTVLDYGGGNAVFAAALAEDGLDCESADLFFGDGPPARTDYAIVTCFEVIEHVPHGGQAEWFAGLRRHLAPHGTLLMSTELLGAATPVDHYYIAPRNGHVSIHSAGSLRLLAHRVGLELCSINREMHVLRVAEAAS